MRVLPVLRAESIKLEPQTRINVDFKPNKKMRKRRELDALVSNGKNRRVILSSSSTKKGQHELLRSVDEDEESETSEEIEFSLAAQNKSVIRKKRTPCWPGLGYIPTCTFILVVLCLLVCGGLIWFLYESRREVGALRSELSTVENTNQGVPDEFQSVHTQIKQIENTMNGGKGLSYLNTQIETILQQLTYLNKTTAALSVGQAKAQDLVAVPAKVEQITQNVASLGSTVKTLQNDVNDLKSFRTRIERQYIILNEDVTNMKVRLSSTTTPAPKPDNSKMRKEYADNFARLFYDMGEMKSTLVSVKDRVSLVEAKVAADNSSGNGGSADWMHIAEKHAKDISLLDKRLNAVNGTLLAVTEQLRNHSTQLRNVTLALRELNDSVGVFTSRAGNSSADANGAVKPIYASNTNGTDSASERIEDAR